ncbi:MAG TPA: aminopeptidase P N-terminal domain-containing protein [Sandaracinaceae bacterium LLY-WYZ-13_1]|nr:aminopeptidase P N-terminal domain-containing protein [Sandaracinaceae bacterium LLY-WYZ-13_1]
MHPSTYRERRRRFLEAMGERSVAVVPAAPTAIRNNDVEHEYRQDSDFYYLTGLDEPQSLLVLSNAHAEHAEVLFVRPRDPSREIWDGPRTGVDGAVAELGADAAFESEEIDQRLVDYLVDAERLYYRLGLDAAMDRRVLDALERARRKHRHGKAYPTVIVDPGTHLHDARLRKDEGELDAMRRAAEITRAAHLAAMRAAKPGGYEYEVEAEILRVFRAHGSERPAYGPIVGSGPNATILHHRKNDRRMEAGDLLLIDAGCELDYYACDVTRTFPIDGTFTEPQRAVYDLVLAAQLACIDATRPGATLEDIHRVAVREITEGLVELGLVEGPPEDAVENDLYKAFFMHRTSHWLGMDVHDVGLYYRRGEPVALEPGMVLTIEPGIYVARDAEVDERWRGIGVRIEDDVLVTEDGCENLTAAIPKAPREIERVLAER